jgi:hypothetical protein
MRIATVTYPFNKIREDNYLYVDKTSFLEKLLNHNDNLFFLQRPRRFGKSLLLSTISSIFKGDAELFEGLALNDSNYDFTEYPILNFNFSSLAWENSSILKNSLYRKICKAARIPYGFSVENDDKEPPEALIDLVTELREKSGRETVILVDEYDGPILKALNKPKFAMKNAQVLGDFFSAVKSLNEQGFIRFSFVTGVSKFSLTSIFSGANVFTDISEDEKYANICGITFEEFDKYLKDIIQEKFAEGFFKKTRFKNFEDFVDALKDMYDGYTWNSVDRVFNPFSLLKAVEKSDLKSYWFRSGTPTFLHKFVRKNPETALNLERIEMEADDLETQTATKVSFVPLLYQTGYLTSALPVENEIYSLKIPNKEVRNSFNKLILEAFACKKIKYLYNLGAKLLAAFKENNAEAIQTHLTELIASISFKDDELSERTFHLFILVFLKLVDITNYYSELNVDSGRTDICFMLDDAKAVLLELKSFKKKPSMSDYDLDKNFEMKFKAAERQQKKYYIPLFAKIKANEIQGIALTLGWGSGVRAIISNKVTRKMTQTDVDNLP